MARRPFPAHDPSMSASTKILVTGLFLLLSLTASSVRGQYRFDSWTTDNGLPQNGVRQITQTPDGYLWFTTFDGLVRFDGVRFTTFSKSNTSGIINNRFSGVFSDTDGTVYAFTSDDGVLTINRNGTFTSFSSDEVPGPYIESIERDSNGQINFVVPDKTQRVENIYRLKGESFELTGQRRSYSKGQDQFFVGASGTNWRVSPTGVTETSNGRSTFYPLDIRTVNFEVALFEDSEGSLWIGEYRVHRLRDGKIRTFDKRIGLPSSTMYHTFWQEADSSVWFASGGGSSAGIGLIQARGNDISIWDGDGLLKGRMIQNVFTDREGTLWLATDKGLIRRRRQMIQAFSTQDGLDHSEVYPLYRDTGDNIWIGTSKGLSIYHNGKFERLDIIPGQGETPGTEYWRRNGMSVQSLWQDPTGKMWVGLNGGIYLIENRRATPLHVGMTVHAIRSDRSGNVWAATNEGLLRFNDYKLTARYSTLDGLPNDFMTFIFEDSKGALWFGGFGGLSKFENGRFLNYSSHHGLTGNYVRTIYEDADGAMWIGTYDAGLSRFKDGRFVNYKESDGLYNSGVFAIEEDEKGFFWISSNRGIYRVNRQELNDFADGKISRINSVGYGKADGMLSNECNGGRQPASLRDKDGNFWFPTQDGVAIVDPLAERTNSSPPSVLIEDLLADRRQVEFRNGAVIAPGSRDIEIQFTGISLIRSAQVKFEYMLEGYDEDWINAGTRRTVSYSSLPPGKYNFRVKAANSDGVWSRNAAAVELNVEPHFYQTGGFILIIVIGGVAALIFIWKISVHQLEAREKRLRRVVAERTAELAKANEILEQLANSDGLTKIGNR
ncbi:MAG: two-component regulator propeller domain-containing protein, partial [Pyrinomonadaceae bacterium]